MGTKTAEPAKKEATKKPAEPKKNYITSKVLADRLGTKPAALRRWLRSLPNFKDGTYTRYKWDPESKGDQQFLKDAEASYKKHKEAESEKNKKRLAEIKKKGEGKADTKKKGKQEEDEEEQGEEGEEEEEI